MRLVSGGILWVWLGFQIGLPLRGNLAGPIQHLKVAILDAWRNKVAADLCGKGGFSERLLVGYTRLLAAS